MNNTPTENSAGAHVVKDAALWNVVSQFPPRNGDVVLTKIDDANGGERNVQTLKKSGNLWFFPDGSMYVYYTPTHWCREPAYRQAKASGGAA